MARPLSSISKINHLERVLAECMPRKRAEELLIWSPSAAEESMLKDSHLSFSAIPARTSFPNDAEPLW
jgi:hypothetical protein